MKTDLKTEFGERLVTLVTGAEGLREPMKCEVKAGPGEHELDFVATDETLDRYGEIIKLDGWDLTNYRRNPVVVDSHNYWSLAALIGNSTEVLIGNGKMRNRVRFAMENPLGAMAFKMAKAGFIHSESVGFIPIEWTNGQGPNEPRRVYTKQELLEISLVSVPANPGATIEAAMKSGAVERTDLTELYSFLKQFCINQDAGLVDSRAKARPVEFAPLVQLARSVAEVARKS